MRPLHRRTLIVGVLVGALAGPTATLAGTGIGAVFNLGRTNTVNRTSTLTGSTSSRVLQVTNSGAGTALRLSVKTGVAPLQVNSSTKVVNLNADRLDGLDSSAFVAAGAPIDASTVGGIGPGGLVQTEAGTTQRLLLSRHTEPLSSGNSNILAVPGFGTIEASCGAGGVPNYRLYWRNTSGATADVWFSDPSAGTSYASLVDHNGTYVAPIDSAADRTVVVTVGLPTGAMVTVRTTAHAGAGGCVFFAQALGG